MRIRSLSSSGFGGVVEDVARNRAVTNDQISKLASIISSYSQQLTPGAESVFGGTFNFMLQHDSVALNLAKKQMTLLASETQFKETALPISERREAYGGG